MKIKVRNPIAELDGDEMTRIIWKLIKERLILPNLDLALEYYDLGLANRDRTDDAVTREAAAAINRLGVGVKCATITPDADRVSEYHLKRAWPSPNGTIRGILDGTVFRKPIVARNLRPAVRSWTRPIIVGRHAYGDLYQAVDFVVPGPGTAELVFTPRAAAGGALAGGAAGEGAAAAGPAGGAAPGGAAEQVRLSLHEFSGPGVVMGMHNTDASISSFAAACVDYALSERVELWFAAKDTISKRYHGRFRDLFAEAVEKRRPEFEAAGIAYRYMLIDDAVARVLKHPGGILWACTNYDGDVFSDMVASGFGSLGMMSSVLVSPKGRYEFEAAHGTVRRHYYEHLKGHSTSTNPIASIFAWTGAIRKRGELDGTRAVADFAGALERAVLGLVEAGVVTKDLVDLIEPRPATYETTELFIDAAAERLGRELERTGA
ncbi:MAG: isocitrate/isopropylmalate family dehydrogenase [Treponema sp.]|nr:isocitrate/isopropylmalate family dehydrogenase [Treponema sp.]